MAQHDAFGREIETARGPRRVARLGRALALRRAARALDPSYGAGRALVAVAVAMAVVVVAAALVLDALVSGGP